MRINPISFKGKYTAYYTDPENGMPFKKTKLYTDLAGGNVTPVIVEPNSRGYWPRLHGQEVYLKAVADCPEDTLSGQMFRGCCQMWNIKYVKEGDESLLNADGIRRRTRKSDGSRNIAYLADFDVDKFEEAMGRQKHTNLPELEKKYMDPETRKQADDIILSGLDIPAPALYITPRMTENADEAVEYIREKDGKEIDDEAFEVKFDKITDTPDECLYYVMKKFGVKKYPVCVMDDTYKIGQAMGFLSPYTKPGRLDKHNRPTY